MADLSTIRLREDAPDVRWVVFIDGCPYAFTTDNGQGGGSLLGTGASSWMGLSETSIGGVEVAGARTVLPGLEMPRTLTKEVSPKSGQPQPNKAKFRLHDTDGTLVSLFAREGKAYDILRQRIAPGTTATAATSIGQGGGSIGLWGRNIGIERIGAAGQRRLFPCLPFSLVGFDHPVHQDSVQSELPVIKVSDEPLQWTGRMVTVWEIYRDPESTATDATAWPTWDDQYTAGALAWHGTVRGLTEIYGQGIFELTCHGWDGPFRRQLGRVSSSTWLPISAELNYGTNEDYIGVGFARQGTSPESAFNSTLFDAANNLTATTKDALITEINGHIQNAFDGTDVNYTPGGGDFDSWLQAATAQNVQVGISPGSGEVYIRKVDMSSDQRIAIMWLILHGRVWRQLGYEPESQSFDNLHDNTDDERQIHFVKLSAGQELSLRSFVATGATIPGSGYWAGRFTTVTRGYSEDFTDSNEWDNGGKKRTWKPKFTGTPYTLDLAGGQTVRIGGGVSPYVEGQLTVYHSSTGEIDSTAVERARFWALRGKVQRENGEDAEDTIQVVRASWVEGNHGVISSVSGAQPALLIEQWLDPRLFGFPYEKLEGIEYWTGVGTGEGGIEIVPLNAYAYMLDDTAEFGHSVLTQMLLSSGSGGGYTGEAISDGNNAPSTDGTTFFGSDLELADLGCAVPYQIVAPLKDFKDAFNLVPGGWNGPMCRVRHAYIGPFKAQEMAESLMRPRRLMWSFHGGQYLVTRLQMFSPSEADLTINERDLYDASPPGQFPNPVGQLDGVALSYRWRPDEGKTAEVQTEGARDSEAGWRTGELIEPITDHGLIAFDWGVPEGLGIGDWRDEFRQDWSFDAAEFFSQDHYELEFRVSRPKGQDCEPGTKILFNNPWPANNAGSYGLTNHVAILTRVEIDTSTHARRVGAFVFAGQSQGLKHFGFMAQIVCQNGNDLMLSTDRYGHGDTAVKDSDGVSEPSWSSTGDPPVVRVLRREGQNWNLEAATTVTAWNADTNTATLNTAADESYKYADRWLLLGSNTDQGANTYAPAVFGPIVLDDLTYGGGGTGTPFYP